MKFHRDGGLDCIRSRRHACGAGQLGVSATFQTFHGSINDTRKTFNGGNVSRAVFTATASALKKKKIQNVERNNLRALFFFNSHLQAELCFKTRTSLTLLAGGRKTKQEEEKKKNNNMPTAYLNVENIRGWERELKLQNVSQKSVQVAGRTGVVHYRLVRR